MLLLEVLKSRVSLCTDVELLHGWITAKTEIFVWLMFFAVLEMFSSIEMDSV